MKKILSIILAVIMSFSVLTVSNAAYDNLDIFAKEIDVPMFTFFDTIIRTFQNFFESFKDEGMRKPVKVTNIGITDGPEVKLYPSNTNATYTIYYFDHYVSGPTDIKMKTVRGIDPEGYVVVVSSDGFVSRTTRVKFSMPEEFGIITIDMNGAPLDNIKTMCTGGFTFPAEEPEWDNHTFLGYSENKYALNGEYKPNQNEIFHSTYSNTFYAIWRENEVVGRGYCGADKPEDIIWEVRSNGPGSITYAFSLRTTIDNPRMQQFNSANDVPWKMFTSSLDKIYIDGVQNISDYAFYRGYWDAKVVIGPSVKEIGKYSFAFFDNLPSITIPETVEKIGEYAFTGCRELKRIEVLNPDIEIGINAFNSEGATLYGPASLQNIEGCPWGAKEFVVM